MAVNKIIEKICKTRLGFKTRNLYIPVLFHADDGLLLSDSVEEIELLIETSAEFGLEVNIKNATPSYTTQDLTSTQMK